MAAAAASAVPFNVTYDVRGRAVRYLLRFDLNVTARALVQSTKKLNEIHFDRQRPLLFQVVGLRSMESALTLNVLPLVPRSNVSNGGALEMRPIDTV